MSTTHDVVNFGSVNSLSFGGSVAVGAIGDRSQATNVGQITSIGGAFGIALFARGEDAAATNRGEILVTGDSASGVRADGDGAQAVNVGKITAIGSAMSALSVSGSNDVMALNAGQIRVTGEFGTGITAGGERTHVTNVGQITVSGAYSSALVSAGSYEATVLNRGEISIDEISITDDVAMGIVAFADTAQVTNEGSITATSTDTIVISAFGFSGGFGLNTGKITTSGYNVTALSGYYTDLTNSGEIVMTGGASLGMGTNFGGDVTNTGMIRINGVTGDGSGSIGIYGVDSQHIRNSGSIEVHNGMGIYGWGEDFDLRIDNSGQIVTEAFFGIQLGRLRGLPLDLPPAYRSADGEVVNSGTVETHGDGAAGVFMMGNGHHLTNSGLIVADGGVSLHNHSTVSDDDGMILRVISSPMSAAGVVVSGDDALVENACTGIIKSLDAASPAVELNVIEIEGHPTAEMSSRLENYGAIRGAVAIQAGAGQETVINHGHIAGDVRLGDGADTFVFGKGGILSGDLLLSEGDDCVVVEDGSGESRIADFVAGAGTDDRIDVSAFFTNFDDLEAHSHQSGNDVIINLDHNDQLVLSNVQLLGLHTDDFLFV